MPEAILTLGCANEPSGWIARINRAMTMVERRSTSRYFGRIDHVFSVPGIYCRGLLEVIFTRGDVLRATVL
jgi:hypothetical protein